MSLIDYQSLYERLPGTPLEKWLKTLPQQIDDVISAGRYGDLPRWLQAVEALPQIHTSSIDFNCDSLRIGTNDDCDDATRAVIREQLQQLHPWRKGPFDIHGIHIDTEWRSDWKWQRVSPHISPLAGRTVLDVGCGSGYHSWRMRGAGAELVIGIDPSMLFVMQYFAVRHFTGDQGVYVLPLAMEHLTPKLEAFDTAFSMGVLYHRRSPLDHLIELRQALRPGGELVLETLVIDESEGQVLMPEDRYAQMRNVWFIPSCETLELWLRRCGFRNIRTVDVNVTTPEEQRRTDWMRFDSLKTFLDPNDPSRSIEGYPGPKRATIIAERP